MDNKKYAFNGKEYSYSDLQSKYGDKTDQAISKFGFKEVIPEPKYIFNGKEYSHSQLQKKYGDRTDEAISKFGFEQVGSKKKDVSDSSVPQQNSESNSKNGSVDYGNRNDGTKKGRGYFGELKMKDGSNDFATEISIGVNIDGKEREIPALVPTLNESEKDWLLKGNDPNDRSEIGEKIIGKAIKHARGRIASNKSPFYEGNVEGTLAWNQQKIKESNPEITKLFDTYQTAKSVSDEKKQEIIQSVEDEVNQSGWWNNIKAYGKKGFNAIVDAAVSVSGIPKSNHQDIKDKFQLQTNPLASELKEVDNQIKQEVANAKKENRPAQTLTDEQRIAKAKELKIEKKITSQSESQVRSYLKDAQKEIDKFGMSDKDKLNLFQTSELASLSEKDKLNLTKQNILQLEINNFEVEKNNFIDQINKGEFTKDEVNERIQYLNDKNRSLLTDLYQAKVEFVSNQKDIGEAKDNIDVLKRNYGWLKNFADNAGATGLDLTAGLLDVMNWANEANGFENPNATKQIRNASKLLTNTATDVREGIAKPISVENINTLGDFGQWFSNTALASQIPIYAAVATGIGGIGALGISATGTQWEEMQSEMDKGNEDYNYFQKTLVPLGYGVSETVSAYVDHLVLMNSARIIQSATAPERRMIAEGMWKGVLNTGKEVGKNAVFEGSDEAATEIMQNLMDIYALDKKDVGVFDNVLDASAAGFAMGAIIPFSASVVSKAIKPFSLDSRIDQANREILKLEKALDDSSLSLANRTIVESQLSKAKLRNQELLEEEVKGISNLSNQEFEAIKRIEKTQSNLKQQAKEIQSSELEQGLKDQIVSNLKQEFEAIENDRVGILNRDSNTLLNLLPQEEVIRLKDEAGRELMQEKNPDGTKNITIEDKEISERALENYRKQSLPNETVQTEDIIDDGNTQPSNEQLDSVQGELENGKKGDNQTQEIQSTKTAERPQVIKASDNGREYTISNEEGRIVFKDRQGNLPSKRTHNRLSLEYAKQTDLTEGKRAHEVEGVTDSSELANMTVKEANKFIADKSESPIEIAETILGNEIEDYRNGVDYKQKVIAENLGHVSRESFIQNSDEVHAKEGGSIPIQYLRKDGTPLDTKAKELSEIAGIEITEQDIVDFILENPTGPQTFLNNGFHSDINSLKARFEELTGLPATNEVIQEIVSQNERKLQLQEQMTSIDFMSEQELLHLLNQREQYEQETANASTKGVREIADSKNNEGKSRVQQDGARENQGTESPRSREAERQIKLREVAQDFLNDVIEKAFTRVKGAEIIQLGKFNEAAKKVLEDISGLKFKREVTFEINEGELRHSNKRHFGKNEVDHRNIPLTKEDYSEIINVVNNPDSVNYIGVDQRTGNKLFEFIKKDSNNNDYVIVQAYGKSGGRLTLKTFFKNQEGIRQRRNADKSPSANVQNRFEASLPDGTKVQNFLDFDIDFLAKEIDINLSKDLKLDKFIENLDRAIDQLDQFGKENLGMNLPLVVARQALQAMKVATKTAKSVADIISAGLNAVKETEWYQNLSQTEKTDLDSNFIDYLNKPYETNRNTRNRSKIENEIEQALKEGKTEKEILASFDDRMEKMVAKDYFERQKEVDPSKAKKQVDDSFDKADKKMEELTKPKFDINKLFRDFVTKFFDRQFLPKFILNKAGGRVVRDYIVTAKGASGYAKYLYEKAYDKIYKGLSSDQIKLLDKVIQLRRFISIDENRRRNNLPAVVHPDYINENVAKSYLDSLKQELGDKAYNDLIKRTDAYFETFKGLLNDMYESGIISKASRDSFFDIDYQPRQFLEFMQNAETETAHLDNGTTGGLGKEQIQKLEKGLDTALVTDSQYLLSRALGVRAKTIAMNNTNRRLADFMKEQAVKVEELKKKDKPTKKEKDIIKYFELLQKRVKENPIIGFTESGNPKYKRTTPNGYANAYYWVNGVKQNMFMEQEFHDQYFDALKRIFSNPDVKEKFAMASGTGLVKSIATGNNPTFFITNTPRDFLFISTFSEEYGKNVLLNMAKLTKDATLGIRDIKKENDTYKNFVKYGGMTDFLMDQGKFKGTNALNARLPKVDNKTRERWGKFFDAVTLQKLQMYSEIGFRMGVFRRSIANQLKELGLKDISEVQDKRTLDDIYHTAASSARNTMDFNQGGTLTKDMDAFIPYLNAASQGTRVMFDNFRDRPIETTLRITQAAAIVAPIPIGLSLMFLGGSERGDDEKELSSVELYNKALKGVSKYDRSNYFIIFNGNRSANGEFQYYRIAKAQQLTPFFTMVEGTLQKAMRESVGDKEIGNMIEDLNWILQNNISPVEFAITDNLARNPLAKAALSLSTGYDFFREQDISSDRGKVPVAAEGYGSKSVEDFYKKIGETSGWSPARMKAAVESIITTPSTSPYVGMIYGGMDAMFSDKDTEQVMQKFAKDMAKSSVNRVVKETSEYNRRIGNKEKIKEAVEEIEINRLKTKLNFNTLVADLKERKITQKEIDKELDKLAETEPFEARRVANRISDQLKNQKTPAFVFEVKYARSAKEKAVLLVDKFGDALKDPSKLQEKEKEIMVLLRRNSAVNSEVWFEYEKLVK